MNRAEWNLHYESPRLVALRTIAPDNPHIWEERRFRGADSRPITHWGIEEAQDGPIAAPGKYSVRLTVDGKSLTQPLTILKDPRTPGTDADLESSFQTSLRIREDISAVSDTVNQIEWMRKELSVVEGMLKSQSEKGGAKGEDKSNEKSDLLKSVQQMDQKLQDVEYKLISLPQANSDDKYYVSANKIYLDLIWLNGEVGTGAGDVAGGAGFAPTDTDLSVLAMIEKDLAAAQTEYHALLEKDIPAFNHSLADRGIVPLTAALPAAPTGGK